MRKLFTLICALVGITMSANAATVDDVSVCKHSYVLVMDDATNDGKAKPGKGQLFGDGFFLDATGGSVATNKGSIDLSDAATWGDAIAKKYGEYGSHLNSFRLKNAQDHFAMKVTAGSKVIIFFNGQSKTGTAARIPKIAADNTFNTILNKSDAPTAETGAVGMSKVEWTADDDRTIYVGSWNGDLYVSYVIVEANEAPGTPSVKVGDQKFENGLFFREVTCKPVNYEIFGSEFPTVVTYTTDGTEPTAESPVYKDPIKCYQDMNVKFQAFVSYDGQSIDDKCEGADNEGVVSFSFDAPSIDVDETGKVVTINSAYATDGATVKYYHSYGDVADEEGQSITLDQSATVSAYVKIVNGSYGEFTSKFTTKDVYVLNSLTKPTTLAVKAGQAVRDEAESVAQGKDVYVIEGGELNADPMEFFVKNLEFGAIANADEAVAKYQVPAGQEAYIKMNATNISFKVDGKAHVTVTCSKNACKNIDSETATDRQCKVTVNGVTYGNDDITAEGANVIEFDVEAGVNTFTKFSGTGNILISSISIVPEQTGVAGVAEAEKANAAVVKTVKNGQVVIVKGDAEYSVTGAQLK